MSPTDLTETEIGQARAENARASAAESRSRALENETRAFCNQAQAIYNLIMPREGGGYVYDPRSIVEAVTSGDLTKLRA